MRAQEIVTNTTPEEHSEIPQLWNMRGLSRIRLENGKIIDNETGLDVFTPFFTPSFSMNLNDMVFEQQLPAVCSMSCIVSHRFVPTGTWAVSDTGSVSNLHAIYGGVEFGLDRFELAQRHAPWPEPVKCI